MNRADRKKQLIAEGVLYRTEVMFAARDARDSLRPDTLARSALRHAMLIGLSALKTRKLGGLPGMNLMTLLPLAARMLSLLSRRKGVAKVVLGGVAIAGTVAGVMRLFSKTKKADGTHP